MTVDTDTAACTTATDTLDEVPSEPLETGSTLGGSDTSPSVQLNGDDGRRLFGNGRLDRWLSERRAFHKQPKLSTLDGWLSPSKTTATAAASPPKKSPTVSRTRASSREKSPVALREKTDLTNVSLESSYLPGSPSADIRKYFRSRVVPPAPMESEHESGPKAENELSTVIIIDSVEDSPLGTLSEHSSEANDRITSSQRETISLTEAAVKSPSCRHNSKTPRKPSDSEHSLDWWATSRTKSSTRKGPFKRSLGLVHFLNEVRLHYI